MILLLSFIVPEDNKNLFGTKIHKKGIISTKQFLKDSLISNYIFITRPKEIFTKFKLSEKQHNKIIQDISKNPIKALNSESHKAHILDENIKT